MEKRELNRKLAEWAGFEFKEVKFGMEIIPQWCGINFANWEPPDFTLSLDACFKWLVPKLGMWEINHYNDDEEFSAWVSLGFDDWNTAEIHDITPALALCLAIEKLIEQEKLAK